MRAGWAIPSAHRGAFDAAQSGLARYATRFDTVEINSSFYRSHRRETYERWSHAVPRGFRFSVKMPRTITHEAGLRNATRLLEGFLEEAAGLGTKLGGILIQLAPSHAFDVGVARRFLTALRLRTTAQVWIEPRHSGWVSPRASDLLIAHDIGRVAADPPRIAGTEAPGACDRSRYWRWHGSPHVYYDAYSDAALDGLVAAVKSRGAVRSTWCIFDNTAAGHAVADALRLKRRFANRP